jgi:hypothetical protein
MPHKLIRCSLKPINFCLFLLLTSCFPPLLKLPPQKQEVAFLFQDPKRSIQGQGGLAVFKNSLCGVSPLGTSFSMNCLDFSNQSLIFNDFQDAPRPAFLPSYPITFPVVDINPPGGRGPFLKNEKGEWIPAPEPTPDPVFSRTILSQGSGGYYLGLGNVLIQSATVSLRVDELKWKQLLPQAELSADLQPEVIAGMTETPSGELFLADTKRNQIFRLFQGKLEVFAGSGQLGFADGSAKEARFEYPRVLRSDAQGNLYLLEYQQNRLRKISPGGRVSTLAGSAEVGYRDGKGSEARFKYPTDLTVSPEGVVFVADTFNHRIRRIEPDGTVSTFIGNGQQGVAEGPRLEIPLDSPQGLVLAPDGTLYFTSGEQVLRTATR